MFGRRHFHFLVAGARVALVNLSTCFWIADKWEKLGGGMARIRVFDSGLNAGSYILKRSGSDESNWRRCVRVLQSSLVQSLRADVLADRVWKVAGWRSEYDDSAFSTVTVIAAEREIRQGGPCLQSARQRGYTSKRVAEDSSCPNSVLVVGEISFQNFRRCCWVSSTYEKQVWRILHTFAGREFACLCSGLGCS